MNWKEKIKAPYSEVKQVLRDNLFVRDMVEDDLGERYIGHYLDDNDDIICPFTGKITKMTFHDPKRWGLFNSCEHCNPELHVKDYKCEETKEIVVVEDILVDALREIQRTSDSLYVKKIADDALNTYSRHGK